MIEIDPNLNQYLEKHTNEEPDLLRELMIETHQATTQPHMASGHYQGRILSMISKLIQPKTILEIGTFTGYATLCLAEGLAENGKIITLDINDELKYIGEKYFERSPYKNQIEYRIGPALEQMKTIEKESLDLVFIDADKQTYPEYYECSIDLLRNGGVILMDNVLWYGKVYDENANDKRTVILRDLNERVVKDSRVESLILPVRDGITLIRKK
ncbi:O-methyltransferase [Weeksella sp. HMSC059D05]|uniref:O-methyltransferase n=1 Tax=Weeksella sp. HMSC059D05 TaxID=1715139 RepID=UPI0008A65352|nr:O-methyltransferase [Weeksella sp. HMSC059D05]OFM83957.1 methyltransferase [Weeksella sp. HMSC059D05]